MYAESSQFPVVNETHGYDKTRPPPEQVIHLENPELTPLPGVDNNANVKLSRILGTSPPCAHEVEIRMDFTAELNKVRCIILYCAVEMKFCGGSHVDRWPDGRVWDTSRSGLEV